MEERFKDMTPYDRAVRISLYSNRVGKMEEQKDHTEDPEAVKALSKWDLKGKKGRRASKIYMREEC